VSELPLSVCDVKFFDLSVSTSNKDKVVHLSQADQPIAGNRHRGLEDGRVNAENSHFSSRGSTKHHVSLDVTEGVVSNEPSVWQLALPLS
jgi:hypothetical protein